MLRSSISNLSHIFYCSISSSWFHIFSIVFLILYRSILSSWFHIYSNIFLILYRSILSSWFHIFSIVLSSNVSHIFYCSISSTSSIYSPIYSLYYTVPSHLQVPYILLYIPNFLRFRLIFMVPYILHCIPYIIPFHLIFMVPYILQYIPYILPLYIIF